LGVKDWIEAVWSFNKWGSWEALYAPESEASPHPEMRRHTWYSTDSEFLRQTKICNLLSKWSNEYKGTGHRSVQWRRSNPQPSTWTLGRKPHWASENVSNGGCPARNTSIVRRTASPIKISNCLLALQQN
jgi:hypothetical protein